VEKNKYIAPMFVFIFAFVWFILGCNFGINVYDEGIGIVGALRVLNGEAPYRDFWTIYSPGWFYVLALWMKIFGSQLIAVRVFTILINSLSVLLIYKTLIKRRINPYLATLATTMFLSLSPFYGRAVPLAILLTLGIIYLLLNKKKREDFAAIGILLATLFTIRHDFGMYALSATILVLLFEYKFYNYRNFKNIAFLFAFYIVILTIFILLLANADALEQYFQYAFKFVFEKFAATRSLPFPNPIMDLLNFKIPVSSRIFNLWQSIVFYIPFVVVLSVFYLFSKSKIDFESEALFFFTLAIFSIIFSMQGMVRSGYEHIIPSLIISTILATSILKKFNITNKFIFAALLFFIVIAPTAKKFQTIYYVFSDKSEQIKTSNARFIKLLKEDAENYNNLIEYIKIFSKGEYLYSGVLHHDRIFINDIMLYHLTNRKPASKFHELHPGQATEANDQKQIIGEIKAHNLPLLVLYYDPQSEKQKFTGESILDEYIRENYILSKFFGNYFVFKRKDLR